MSDSGLLSRVLLSPPAHRLGWTLLHSLWQLLAIALLLAICLAVLRRRSPHARYVASCLALAAMAAAAVITFVLLPTPHPHPATLSATPARITEAPPTPAPRAQSPAQRPARLPSPEADENPPHVVANAPADHSLKTYLATVQQNIARRIPRLLPWLVLAWAMGVFAFSAWNLGGWILVQRLKSRSTRPVDPAVSSAAAALADRLGLRRVVRLLQSTRIDSPLVIGTIKPLILLPAALLSGLPMSQIESILAHELAHVRRHDYLVNLVQTVIETLLFYHPAVWWVARRVRADREHCCDDIAVTLTRDRATYVEALAAVAATAAPALAPAAAGPAGSLLSRARRLLGIPDADTARPPSWVAALAAAGLCLAIVLTTTTYPASGQAAPATRPADTLSLIVTDSATAVPVAGATIEYRPFDPKNPGASRGRSALSQSLTTDTQGRAAVPLSQIDPTIVVLTVSAPGHATVRLSWIGADGRPRVPADYALKLTPARPIAGTVEDDAGHPVEGATVSLTTGVPPDDNRNPTLHYVPHAPASSDAQGRWHFDDTPPDLSRATITVTQPRYLETRVDRSAIAKFPDDRSFKIILRRGVAVSGRVTDEQGRPVAGAKVAYDFDRRSDYPSTTTDADGRFSLPAQPQKTTLFVQAPGKAPVMREVTPPADVQIKLAAAHSFSGRAVDTAGHPIPGVTIYVSRWQNERLLGLISATTGADGHFSFDGPDFPMGIDAFVRDYMRLSNYRLSPDEAATLVFHHPLKFTGAVTDAETGQPIASFTVSRGYGAQRSSVFWDPLRPVQASNGQYEILMDFPRDSYAVRIEADGYAPASSDLVTYGPTEDNKVITFNAKLRKSADISGTVLSPDGKPVPNADVLLATPNSQTVIQNGRPTRQTSGRSATTDAQGRFSLPPTDGTYTLIILADQGYAEVSKERAAASNQITLQPWARVEGRFLIGDKPAVGQAVVMSRRDDAPPDRKLPRVIRMRFAETDADGRFAFDRVPAGPAYLGRRVPIGGGRMFTQSMELPINPEPGQTLTVQLGGAGRAATGRLIAPADLHPNWRFEFCAIETPAPAFKPTYPPNWETMSTQDRRDWLAKWQSSEEAKAYHAKRDAYYDNRRTYAFSPDANGNFRIEDVPPGEYQLSAQIFPNVGSNYDVAKVSARVTIPAGQGDVDLGKFTMEKLTPPRVTPARQPSAPPTTRK